MVAITARAEQVFYGEGAGAVEERFPETRLEIVDDLLAEPGAL
ncbi:MULTISPECIES: hypothetical protein [Streptomyces]|uniref:Uncharacterized protein n=1 Tax=Streptomyces virginiae TaxID=1961 RepID=A0ABQ3NY21_STRVG|nr:MULTISPECIES: hypothetical protein [Streptomyces]MBP2348678.1 hypothetical protein [Streptomyces virginiae]GGQ00681.1 hypothetical protein GCM10010215_27940 [Streptomyces virginiae]GHI17678.1 hypothetical protein Scinn_71410 [Streptomyces virginiae]GLV91331.1 hypothetical protein Slala04_27850 [Streptomyces lavendulae subsp. lavendulae]